MAKNVIWTATAKESRKNILSLFSKPYATKLSVEINSIVNTVSDFEQIGKICDFEDVRKFVFKHYSIFYKIRTNDILIVGLLDNRRNPDEASKEIEL